MAETQYNWPARDQAQVIGKRTNRVDGKLKATGQAKYTYDINLKNQLIAKAVSCPHAHCRIKSIDTAAAESSPGVVAVQILPHAQPGSEIEWEGELLVVVAAESEGAAAAGVAAVKIEYEPLEVFVRDSDLKAAQAAQRTGKGGGKVITEKEPGDDVEDEDAWVEKEFERLFQQAKYVVDGYYGIDAITHCCLETHGSTVQWQGDNLVTHLSTQNVSGTEEGFARDLEITSDKVEVHCDFIGGGFGSKFSPDYWSLVAAKISRQTGRPVKFMLDRAQDQKTAGNRPSVFMKVRLGADEDGVVQVWDSEHWGTSGHRGGGVSHTVLPYVLTPKNIRRNGITIATNNSPSRAWRAPNHPQACLLTMAALDDLAAKMGKNSYDVFLANLVNASNGKAEVYADQMRIAADLMEWRAKWHPHGKGPLQGSIVEGLGMSLHTWAGGANSSSCLLRISPDGGVETFCGTQDLGTGTRTVCNMVVAETFGLPLAAVKINIGNSKYPPSGPSGGSTTIGAVCESHRRAAQDAWRQLAATVAAKLEAAPEQLVAVGGRVQVQGQAAKSISWQEACSTLGLKPLEVTSSYKQGTPSPLSNADVGGVQMAHVAVDKETGVIRMKKFVAVQDQGLVINPKTCESQLYGAIIMGISTSLFEQRINDPQTGQFINAQLSDYKLPRLGDVGQIVVQIYEPESERQRGVIGNGEPPVISPAAAISNAVANALGVRVPVLPMTPQRVLEALQQTGRA